MNATSRNHEEISILALGKNRQVISQMLEHSGLRFSCDWLEQEDDALRENYHDVALVYLGERSRAHLNPIGERERKAIGLLSSMGIPCVIIGPEAVGKLLEGVEMNWDWTFISDAELDSEHLLQGVHDALGNYLTGAHQPAACHRFKAWLELEDHGFS